MIIGSLNSIPLTNIYVQLIRRLPRKLILWLESHVYTTVAGNNCTILAYTDQKCNAAPYSDEYERVMGVYIVYAATGYTTAQGRNLSLF